MRLETRYKPLRNLEESQTVCEELNATVAKVKSSSVCNMYYSLSRNSGKKCLVVTVTWILDILKVFDQAVSDLKKRLEMWKHTQAHGDIIFTTSQGTPAFIRVNTRIYMNL